LFRQFNEFQGIIDGTTAAHPELHQALEAVGTHLDPATGEVAGVPAQLVEAMSERKHEVVTEQAALEAQWRAEHPGEEPGRRLLDRLKKVAWRTTRQQKQEGESAGAKLARWQGSIREHGGTQTPGPAAIMLTPATLTRQDRERIGTDAVNVLAGRRATWGAGDISREVSSSLRGLGVVANRRERRVLEQQITNTAVLGCLPALTLSYEQGVAEDLALRALTSGKVIAARDTLEEHFARLAGENPPAWTAHQQQVAEVVLHGHRHLSDQQREAALAVAGPASLVVVEGAAGAGKTTVLAAARDIAQATGSKLLVLAPSATAAKVAAAEIGVPAFNVHEALHALGWRWNKANDWTKLAVGDTDPTTGKVWAGPGKNAPVLDGRTRVHVDEAGMLDQYAANALLTEIRDTGASVSLGGDRQQLKAVGVGGVMRVAAQYVDPRAMVDLYRFRDPDYARLTLAMRDRDPRVVRGLIEGGYVRVAGEGRAVESMARWVVERLTQGVDVLGVAATNEDAATANAFIQTALEQSGVIEEAPYTAWAGVDGLRAGVGSVIQTRKNDRTLRVSNRQRWKVVGHTALGGMIVDPLDGAGTVGGRVHLPAEYVAEHTHLAWVSTAYGVQGATCDEVGTVVTDTTSAAGLYVPMTRGRAVNLAFVDADTLTQAADLLRGALAREGVADLADAVEQVRRDLHTYAEPLTDAEQRGLELARLRVDAAALMPDAWETTDWATALRRALNRGTHEERLDLARREVTYTVEKEDTWAGIVAAAQDHQVKVAEQQDRAAKNVKSLNTTLSKMPELVARLREHVGDRDGFRPELAPMLAMSGHKPKTEIARLTTALDRPGLTELKDAFTDWRLGVLQAGAKNAPTSARSKALDNARVAAEQIGQASTNLAAAEQAAQDAQARAVHLRTEEQTATAWKRLRSPGGAAGLRKRAEEAEAVARAAGQQIGPARATVTHLESLIDAGRQAEDERATEQANLAVAATRFEDAATAAPTQLQALIGAQQQAAATSTNLGNRLGAWLGEAQRLGTPWPLDQREENGLTLARLRAEHARLSPETWKDPNRVQNTLETVEHGTLTQRRTLAEACIRQAEENPGMWARLLHEIEKKAVNAEANIGMPDTYQRFADLDAWTRDARQVMDELDIPRPRERTQPVASPTRSRGIGRNYDHGYHYEPPGHGHDYGGPSL
jgi:hypothetical protein